MRKRPAIYRERRGAGRVEEERGVGVEDGLETLGAAVLDRVTGRVSVGAGRVTVLRERGTAVV